jgi:hypothetical protein
MSQQLIPFARDVAANLLANLLAAAILIGIGYLTFRRARILLRALGFAYRMSKNGFINFYNSREEYYTARRQKTLEDYMLLAKKDFLYVGFICRRQQTRQE